MKVTNDRREILFVSISIAWFPTGHGTRPDAKATDPVPLERMLNVLEPVNGRGS